MKDQSRFFTYFIVVLSLITLSVGAYAIVSTSQGYLNKDSSKVDRKELYPLRNNATEYQKEVHKELITAIKEDNPQGTKISGLLAQNFVADYFTWTNKLRFNDIGGIQFIKPEYRSWVYDKSLDTFYHDLKIHLDDNDVEETLEVNNVKVHPTKTVITMDDKEVSAYLVKTNWTYRSTPLVNEQNYQQEAYITVVEGSDGYFSIVEVNHDED